MSEGVASNYGLIGLDREVHEPADHSAGAVYLGGIDARSRLVICKPGPEHHDYFFEGCVSGPFADSVDRAFYLVRSVADRGDAVCDRQSEVVMAMDAQKDAVQGWNCLTDPADEV